MQNAARWRQPRRLGVGTSMVPVGIMGAIKGHDKGVG
jgi:hypothetical protein